MDSLTHLVAGALTPLAFKHTPKRAAVLTFGMLAGSLPDMDFIYGGTVESLLTVHRGITHALFWLPFWVLLPVIPWYIWMQSRPACAPSSAVPGGALPAGGRAGHGAPGSYGLVTMYAVALAAVLVHVYLDCMTTFGTMALLPFSGRRVEFPAMFIVDLLLTVPALILCVKAWRMPPDYTAPPAATARLCGPGGAVALVSPKARRLARAALAWVLLYPLAALGINYAATAALQPRLTDGDTPGKLMLTTEPFSPFMWKAVVDEGKTYRMGKVFLPAPPASGDELQRFVKPEPMLYDTLKAQHPIFTHFESFCPFMVQTQREAHPVVQADYQSPVTEYAFMDLRYVPAKDGAAEFIGRRSPMFVLEARVNESGALLAYRFLKRTVGDDEEPWIAVQ